MSDRALRPHGDRGSVVRVLHVDDEPAFLDLVATYLERMDDAFEVRSETDVDAALDAIESEPIDCVVSDYEMPGTDGLDFLERVRERDPTVPFILFTGKGSEEIASEAISAGVTDYLQKRSGTDQYTVLANRIANAVSGHRAAREAEQRADRLQRIRENVSDVVWISDPGRERMLFVSDSYGEVWGLDPGSLVADPDSFLDGVHPDDRARVRGALADQRERPDGYEETYRVVRPDGEVRWVTDRASGAYEDGTLERIVGVATDVTALKEYERELKAERAFTTSALEVAVDFYWGIDLDGYVTRWADEGGEVTGYTEQQAVGLHTSNFHPDDHVPRIQAAIEELEETGSVVVEADLLTRGGERVPFEFAGTVVTDEDGNVVSMCGVGRDLSDREQ